MADQTYPIFEPKRLLTTLVTTFVDTDGKEKVFKSAARMADALGAAASLHRSGTTPKIYKWSFKANSYEYDAKESTESLKNRLEVDAKNAANNGSKAQATPQGKLIEQSFRDAKIDLDLCARAVREDALNAELKNRLTRALIKALVTCGVSQQAVAQAWNEVAPKPVTPATPAPQPQPANR